VCVSKNNNNNKNNFPLPLCFLGWFASRRKKKKNDHHHQSVITEIVEGDLLELECRIPSLFPEFEFTRVFCAKLSTQTSSFIIYGILGALDDSTAMTVQPVSCCDIAQTLLRAGMTGSLFVDFLQSSTGEPWKVIDLEASQSSKSISVVCA
jgi:hypothetical protein